MSGLGDNLKGKAKEAAGNLTGDEELKAKGKAQQVVGNLKDQAEDAKDSIGEKVNEKLDDLQEKTEPED